MRQKQTYISMATAVVWFLCVCGAALLAQTKPASPDPQEENAVLKLASDLNTAVAASDARGVRRLLYVPQKDYDFAGMQRYLEQVAAGEFKGWEFAVLHAEVEGEYAAVIIRQKPPGGTDGEITPVALFKPGVRWRILPFDLRKDHPEVGGEAAGAAYAQLLKRAGDWVRANTNAKAASGSTTAPTGRP
jgi:hypothetical protein